MSELGDLLRSRRERLQPADVGLPAGPRRRAAGLRREEVAALAAISPTYYTFLEQGRETTPSRPVLDALAAALRLDETERAHLHLLAHGSVTPPAPDSGAERLDPEVADLVDRLDPYPTYVSGRYWDILAANRAACALWTDWPEKPFSERNMVWWTFTDPAARRVFVDWEQEAIALLGRLRAAAARNPDDPGFGALIDRLCAASPQAREWWSRHDVAPLSPGLKRLRHQRLGEVRLRHVVLTVADDPEQKVVTFTADAAELARIRTLLQEG